CTATVSPLPMHSRSTQPKRSCRILACGFHRSTTAARYPRSRMTLRLRSDGEEAIHPLQQIAIRTVGVLKLPPAPSSRRPVVERHFRAGMAVEDESPVMPPAEWERRVVPSRVNPIAFVHQVVDLRPKRLPAAF